ncbi:hypothetical protein [Pedobacter punctiformis]|uniref:HEPN domain-containing protein n=1 Tax=Pedobacter punctiformis TaxID=3004097 RepID=A0ABT4LCS9_9SPHI|nr:hypothetical protein [Pedobacter sp. HCMS5-2]MCZ4245730.1 hypothetical protein [Pedobacter sp. HCMS5-2]
MNAYRCLLNKIYPARIGEQSDLLLYFTAEKAFYNFQNAKENFEVLQLEFRNAFFFLRKHLCNCINDAYSVLKYRLDNFDKKQLEFHINKLNSSFYDINELESILSHINIIIIQYELASNEEHYPILSKSA